MGAAEMIRAAARRQKLPGNLYQSDIVIPVEPPMAEVFIHTQERQQALARLQSSTISAVQALLRTRALNDTKLFAPSSSAAGQAYDTAVVIAGTLIAQGSVVGPLRTALEASAASANAGGDTTPLEHLLLDFLSLGERLNADQAGVFLENVQDTETFTLLAQEVRDSGSSLPTLYGAVVLSGQPKEVATYVRDYADSGLGAIANTYHFGVASLKELIHRQQRAYGVLPPIENSFSLALDNFCLTQPGFAMTVKCLAYLLGGFLLALAAHFARPVPSRRERPLEVPGVHVARESLFALGFLLVAILLSEPFLAQQSQKMEIRLHLPTVGNAVTVGSTPARPSSLMNSSNSTLLTLALFFVLQALLYVACLVKLAEIRRQNALPRTKLKLLENEEHLFDAGLYLGFCGTIVSLILASLGVTGWSLMAAYSSTSFGIIFVSIFKIFHLRPTRRDLLLQSEDQTIVMESDPMHPSMATLP